MFYSFSSMSPCFFNMFYCFDDSMWARACRSLGPLAYAVASVPLVACLDVTAYETHLCNFGVLDTHLSPCAMMLCLPCLLFATCLAFFYFLHFCMLAYMLMH